MRDGGGLESQTAPKPFRPPITLGGKNGVRRAASVEEARADGGSRREIRRWNDPGFEAPTFKYNRVVATD